MTIWTIITLVTQCLLLATVVLGRSAWGKLYNKSSTNWKILRENSFLGEENGDKRLTEKLTCLLFQEQDYVMSISKLYRNKGVQILTNTTPHLNRFNVRIRLAWANQVRTRPPAAIAEHIF